MSEYLRLSQARAAVLESAIARFVSIAKRHEDVEAVYAFGSIAENRVGPFSDLDLLVVRRTTLVGPERGTDLAVEARLDVACDLVVVTPEESATVCRTRVSAERFYERLGESMQRDRFVVARTWLHSAERDIVVARLALEVEPALAAFHAQ